MAWEIGTQYTNEPPWQIHFIMLKESNFSTYLRGYLHRSDNIKFFTFLTIGISIVLLGGENTRKKFKIKILFVVK